MKRAREQMVCGVCRRPIHAGEPMHMVSFRGYLIVAAHPQCRPPIATPRQVAS